MAGKGSKLTARQVVTLGEGYHADGGGLYLQVVGSGRSWILRYQLCGKRREMGLGPVALFGLADARQRAQEARRLLADGIDPIAHRRTQRATHARLWGDAVTDFIAAHESGWKNEKQAHQWKQSLDDHGPDKALPVAALDTAAVLKVLRGIWSEKTETATRIRGRIERIWDAEKVAGNVTGENPARWKGHLSALLPRPAKVAKPKHHKAMPYALLPAFMARLCERDGRARRALRFTILCAARTGEVTGAEWGEFAGDLWTIPVERMKGGKPHVVPLSKAAVAILDALPRSKPPFRLTENAMLYLLQKDMGQPYTVHGFRSAFSDWAHETTDFPNHVIEMALAHTIPNKAEAAYRRGSLLDKRRALMEAWADYCNPRK